MQHTILQVQYWLARIFLVGLLIQLYLAGAPMFGVTSFQPHRTLGGALTVLALLFPVLAIVGRLGRRRLGLSILLVVIFIVQGMLPALRGTAPWIAGLHTVNAIALMGVSAAISRGGRTEAVRANEPVSVKGV